MNVTVIIAVFNSEDTIIHCLDSLAEQSINREDFEVICVDDGSTDSTSKLLKEYNHILNYKVVRHENNGPAFSRNKGAQLAEGKIILFTDADCILDGNWIIEMIEPFKNESITGVQGSYRTKQKKLIALFDQIDMESRYKKLKKNDYIDSIATYSAAYRRDTFLKYGGFNTNYKQASGEDFELSFLLSKEGHKLIFSENAICYHKHPDSIIKYLKTKFSRGYWRTLLYKNFKNKIYNDTYTSLLLKLQYLSITLFFISTVLVLFNFISKTVPIVCVTLFILLQIPFFIFALKKNIKVAFLSFPIVTFRSIFFLSGMLLGVTHVIMGKLK
uniref:Glycosyltransferases, probably involved in cell wall biogenesis n=1 Tax=uncultured verrucomicrobium HF0500_08N17 TaxID=723597 RepID=E7C4Y2_9BACT|nr:glycosyltransferases, probably involved in cell wall biogenesis [uncultured verrucomicrobium HF0500_08N17]